MAHSPPTFYQVKGMQEPQNRIRSILTHTTCPTFTNRNRVQSRRNRQHGNRRFFYRNKKIVLEFHMYFVCSMFCTHNVRFQVQTIVQT